MHSASFLTLRVFWRTVWYTIIAIMAMNHVSAQTIRLVRSDALPARSGFVTARLPFSVDVVVENVQGCTAVSFDLLYNNTDNITYSGREVPTPSPFGQPPISFPNVTVVNRTDPNTGQGLLTVGAILPQAPANSNGLVVSTFTVVRLNFTVGNNALHGSVINMRFTSPEAVIVAGNGTTIRLSPQISNYTIRGIVNVWPGDADNNGIVNSRDFALFSRFYDAGGAAPQDPVAPGVIRGFPRNPPSTLWAAQSSIAWDSVEATYVDADGDGIVGVSDILVWLGNLGRTRPLGLLSTSTNDTSPLSRSVSALQTAIQTAVRTGEITQTGSRVRIPVEVRSSQRALGISMRLSWRDIASRYRVIGIEQGPLFGNSPAVFQTISRDSDTGADIVIGNANPSPETSLNGTIAYIVADVIGTSPPAPRFAPVFSNVRAVRSDGSLFTPDGTVSSVNSTNGIQRNALLIAPNPAENRISLTIPKPMRGMVKVYTMSGKILLAQDFPSLLRTGETLTFDVSALPAGSYILAFDAGIEVLTASFVVAR